MIFSKKSLIEDYVVEILDKGSLTGPDILSALNVVRGPVTKQALYKVLRKLKTAEVINKQGVHYSLNRVWLQEIKQFSSRHIQESSLTDVVDVLSFEDGDSVTYKFKNPFLMDIAWGHLYDIVYDATPKHQAMLNYHPHEWLILSRPKTEEFWLNRFTQDKKKMLFTIGGATFLDKKFQKEYSSKNVSINLNESYGLKQNQYLSVQGDYVFEITTDNNFEKKIGEFFGKIKKIEEINQKDILELSQLQHRTKLRLTKSKKKADSWRTKFKKDFYIPKPYYLFEGSTKDSRH